MMVGQMAILDREHRSRGSRDYFGKAVEQSVINHRILSRIQFEG